MEWAYLRLQGWLAILCRCLTYTVALSIFHLHNSAMIHEPRGAGSGQSTHPLSPSEKIAHGGNRTRGSLPLAPWPEERQPTELPPPK